MYRFCIKPNVSPTFFNVHFHLLRRGWKSAQFPFFTSFNYHHFNLNKHIAETLEFKHLLAQLVDGSCPEVMPRTYRINDKNWPNILNQLTAQSGSPSESHNIWILKPSLLNNGQNIRIFKNFYELESHYSGRNHLGGEHVLQDYISRPHLLKGHKYSVRMFIVLTNYGGVFLYPDGYFNVAQQPYSYTNFNDLCPHLTNEHLTESGNVIQIPTDRFELFPIIFKQIHEIIKKLLNALDTMNPHCFFTSEFPTLGIFGLDFVVDEGMKVWLIEANHGPCFPVTNTHPLQNYLYTPFWNAFIDCFVEPIASRTMMHKNDYSPFLSITQKNNS